MRLPSDDRPNILWAMNAAIHLHTNAVAVIMTAVLTTLNPPVMTWMSISIPTPIRK